MKHSVTCAESFARATRSVPAALLLIYRPAIERGEPFPVAAQVRSDPAAAVASGWRLAAAGDWTGIRRLDVRLAADSYEVEVILG
jgi:hypothetical protein